jgi:7-cyano-7-deazaguanine tRNA-ribosyltransferase
MIKASEIEKFQEKIGSDLPVILDVPVQPHDDYETAKEKVDLSIIRAKNNIERRTKNYCWIGPIHGSNYLDLLKQSTLEMSNLDFGVYAIGGLVKFFLNYQFKQVLQILSVVKQNIIPNKPLHMFGLGLPQFFSLAIAFGCDLMDSAAYILYAKDDRYFSLTTGVEMLEDLKEFPCNCPICTRYEPAELKKFEKEFRTKLLAKHNLYVSLSELKTIRQAIREGNLWELVEKRVRSHPSLINALVLLKDHHSYFEKYEKIYKDHGRLLSSFESKNRPIIYRYKNRFENRYRVPDKVKYLLILPELDIKGDKSPTINSWFEMINNNKFIQRYKIHIIFLSEFFGLIPLELINSYPMGQYEAVKNEQFFKIIHKSLAKEIIKFIINNSEIYKKCGFLNPNQYINQYEDIVEFNNEIYEKIFQIIKKHIKIPILKASDLKEILKWF